MQLLNLARLTVLSSIEEEKEDMAVDDQNVPGFQHVDKLAELLVGLRDQTSLCHTSQQAYTIIGLWNKLDVRDKQTVWCTWQRALSTVC